MSMDMIEQKEIEYQKNSMIYVSNRLLDSVFKLNLPERRVMWYLVKDYKFNDLTTITIDNEVHHGSYAKLYNISLQQASKEIRNACLSLPDNSFFMLRPEWDKNVISEFDDKILTKQELAGLQAFTKGNIVDHCDYGVEKGKSVVQFTRSFLSHAIPVKDYFTQYRLYEADSLTNANHIALYEELKRWFNDKTEDGIYITTPSRLANKLMMPSTYEAYSQMRRGLLNPAIEAINNKTDLIVKLIETRANKDNSRSKVIKLEFVMSKKLNSIT